MRATNLRVPSENVDFLTAVRRGLGEKQGLYMPEAVGQVPEGLLELSSAERATAVLTALLGDTFEPPELRAIVDACFDFPCPLVPLSDGTYALELFHGPTLAFKDFGARFMAHCLAHARGDAPATVLTATSGDTGAAVAHAFHRVPGVRAIVLYPKGRISRLQEQLFCTLGDNVTTLAVDGTFDDCQALVKAAFESPGLREGCGLTSANSINLARLVAQVVYYAEALAQLPAAERADTTFAVPCGNFGNLTAGLLGRAIGLDLPRFVAATNANDTVPRFLSEGVWSPAPTVATISNAMDVSVPSNWPRAERLNSARTPLQSISVSDETTRDAMQKLHALGYVSEPHSAIAHHALRHASQGRGAAVFLCTAHPAKFRETVEETLNISLPLPPALAEREHLRLLSHDLPNSLDALLPYLRAEVESST